MALQGTLDTFALPDVLRLLAATKKSGRLRITGGHGTGSVWVAGGEVVAIDATHAPHATDTGGLAVRAPPLPGGRLHLRRRRHPRRTVAARRRRDPHHRGRGAARGVARHRSRRAVHGRMGDDAGDAARAKVTVEQGHWTTLVAVGGGATVRRIADELCLGELPISRAVKDLVELGVVEIGEAPPAGALPPLSPRRRGRLDRSQPPPPGGRRAHATVDSAHHGLGARARRAKGPGRPRPASPRSSCRSTCPGTARRRPTTAAERAEEPAA